MKMLFALLFLICTSDARATIIQVLHTNDLHAALNTAGEPREGDPEFGGWAQIKTLLDQYTAAAKLLGMETIRLDAGDFLEGSMLYFPKDGQNVLQAYQQMGFDASTVGNHDWMLGAVGMNQLLGLQPFKHPILAANIHFHSRMANLKKQITPSTIIEKGGVKIGVVGLSTTEGFYKWITKVGSKKKDMVLKSYSDRSSTGYDDEGEPLPAIAGIANKAIQALVPKTDAVIALTHIGFEEDIGLVQKSRGLDLVVGGHSHTFLETLNVEKNLDGREIPIVQTGYNGRMIGRVVMEVIPGQETKVLTYELIPVPHNTKLDTEVAKTVQKANRDLYEHYGNETLNEVIGASEVRLVPGKNGPTAYSKFAVDALRKAIDADVAIDIGAFHANAPQPGGTVNRMKLMEMYPRKFEGKQNEGWYVYRFRMPGIFLAIGLKFAVKFGLTASFSGTDFVPYKVSDATHEKIRKRMKGEQKETLTPYRAKKITVNGQKICLTCTYEIATSEAMIRGAYGITPLTRLLLWRGQKTKVTIWQALEAHLRDIKTIKALEADEHFSSKRYSNYYQEKFGSQIDPVERGMEEAADEILEKLPMLEDMPTETLIKAFMGEMFRAKNLKINSKTDADSLDVEGEL